MKKLSFIASSTILLFTPVVAQAARFVNPLKSTSISDILVNIITWLLGIAALVALLALVVGGIRMIFGGFDNEQEAARAKKIILWAIIGLAVVILSLTIVNIIRTQIIVF